MRSARQRSQAIQELAAPLLFVFASALIAPHPAAAEPTAQSSDPSNHPEQSIGPTEADEEISTLVTQIEDALEAGRITSPDKLNASKYLSEALLLLPRASPRGADTMRDLPGVLKQRAEQEYTQGHWQAGANFEAFADVLELRAAPHDGSSHVVSGSAGTTEWVQNTTTNDSPPTPPAPSQAGIIVEPLSAVAPVPTPPLGAGSHSVLAPNTQDASATPPIRSLSPVSTPQLDVAAIKPSPSKRQPENAQPKTLPSPITLQPDFIGELVQRGDALIALGDISGARRLYTLAAENNSGEAALKLGDTYTPDFFARHGVEGLQPDMQQARGWYQKAAALGNADAERRMTSLTRLK